MIRVAVAGASGFVGGELLRWLVDHPDVELTAATSESNAGRPLARTHPHLRGAPGPRTFSALADLPDVDVLFTAFPHGFLAERIDEFAQRAERIIDCSADFRLRDADRHAAWYGDGPSAEPAWRERFVYGLPELNAPDLAEARYASGVGCNATAVQLALLPLDHAGLLRDLVGPVIADARVGSSEGGASPNPSSHHPIRSGCVRAYAPTGHRHAAEIEQSYPDLDVHLSVTAIEMVRGVSVSCHVTLAREVEERDLLHAWSGAAAERPFLDVVHERAGNYRHPEPKLVAGTNRAQLGFALDPRDRRHLVAFCALDNLGKGAAGTAVQCMNLMCGLDETRGLGFRGLHPI